jgi:acyl-CoA dehydrogenase
MMHDTHLQWPFFEARHEAVAREAALFAQRHLADAAHPHSSAAVDAHCRSLVTHLGEAGLLSHCVPQGGGDLAALDARSLCLIRESLAWHDGLADFAFAIQGLGSGPLSAAGDPALRARYLPRVAAGRAVPAFALSEPDAGSDVAAMSCAARRDGDHYVLDGTKTWISNGGIADFYVVFARTGPEPGARGLSAFVVDADTPGLRVAERIDVVAPHPLATLAFEGCRVGPGSLIGERGRGFAIAMATLDVFRTTVGAAALGFARRAFDTALAHAQHRRLFGQPLAEFQMTQAALADMAVAIDTSALLVYRAAWAKDRGQARVTREAAMAKLHATESAQRVIDQAVQLLGGEGVRAGSVTESLYREIRALRIYEGASEVQKIIIARQELSRMQEGIRR